MQGGHAWGSGENEINYAIFIYTRVAGDLVNVCICCIGRDAGIC